MSDRSHAYAYDPHMSVFDDAPIPRDKDPLGGPILGENWADSMGGMATDNQFYVGEAEPCIVCGKPGITCTHLQGDSGMAQARRTGPRGSTTRSNKPVGTPVEAQHVAHATLTTEHVPGPGTLISDTQDEAGFVVDAPGQMADAVVRTEVLPVDRPIVDDINGAAPAANVDNPQGLPPEPRTENRPAKKEGQPDGYIVQPGQVANRLPVRRIEGSEDYVQAREDIWVERIATGSTRSIYQLLMSEGTIFPKAQLNTRVL